MSNWHTDSISDLIKTFKSDSSLGLSPAEAGKRLKESGYNELIEKGGKKAIVLLWEQFTATMVLILLGAAVISMFLSKWLEAGSIFAIVILFAFLGFIQEYRAERAMAALKRMSKPTVRVRRDGEIIEISSREIVTGDIIILEAGNIVPADCRIIESVNLRIQESMLTGESEDSEKTSDVLKGDNIPVSDRNNMSYMGTIVTYGRGTAIVTGTGMNTELGKIASMIQDVESLQTPLQKRLDQVGKTLALAGALIALFIVIMGLMRGEKIADMFLVAISVAVAIIPEGLPAVVTITLALGAQRMLSRHVLIRKLPSVETLGSVTVICSDKTGTLTQNLMTVTFVDTIEEFLSLHDFIDKKINPDENVQLSVKDKNSSFPVTLTAGALCNDSILRCQDGVYSIVGDPTENAIAKACAIFGYTREKLEKIYPRVSEIPFDSVRKRMTTFHKNTNTSGENIFSFLDKNEINNAGFIAVTKGAPDSLLEISERMLINGKCELVNKELKDRIHLASAEHAKNGIRLIGISVKPVDLIPNTIDFSFEKGMIFLGIFGMIDPPRAEAQVSVEKCRTAGIRPVMITGDHPLTALNIATRIGITTSSRVLSGSEINMMSEEDFEKSVEETDVYARVSPEHKLMIVNALQKKNHIVAMTGDGVNDAPALKKANIGVAMGITGTDVSKEAADIVLLDDNFASIVSAVEEGRVIYDNIRKFLKFSIAGNTGKTLVMIFAPFFSVFMPSSMYQSLTIPLLPLQLLWLNLLTDGLLGIGLGVERPEKSTMRRPPFSPAAGIFSDGIGGQIIRMGFLIGIISLGAGIYYCYMGNPNWQTIMFSTLAFSQMWQALGTRSMRESLFSKGFFFSNPAILGMVLFTFILQLSSIYVPVMQIFLSTTPLTLKEFIICISISSLVLIFTEIEKLYFFPKEFKNI